MSFTLYLRDDKIAGFDYFTSTVGKDANDESSTCSFSTNLYKFPSRIDGNKTTFQLSEYGYSDMASITTLNDSFTLDLSGAMISHCGKFGDYARTLTLKIRSSRCNIKDYRISH